MTNLLAILVLMLSMFGVTPDIDTPNEDGSSSDGGDASAGASDGESADGGNESAGDNAKDPSDDVSTSLPGSILMRSIPGGSFTMGGSTNADDSPEVVVTVSDFAISEKEVTNVEYVEFLNGAYQEGWLLIEAQETRDPCGQYVENMIVATDHAPHSGQNYLQLGETGGCTSDGFEEDIDNKSWITFNTATNAFSLIDAAKSDWPVNWVRWFGADAFAQFYGVSLPTEAQWEYAARGGQQLDYPTDDGTLSSEKANYNGDQPGVHNETGHSIAVGSYAPNPFLLYDMGGNVWEWCADYYAADFYSEGAVDPVNSTATTEGKRVRRGGSWNYHAATLLTYARAGDFPDGGNNHFGFRIVAQP